MTDKKHPEAEASAKQDPHAKPKAEQPKAAAAKAAAIPNPYAGQGMLGQMVMPTKPGAAPYDTGPPVIVCDRLVVGPVPVKVQTGVNEETGEPIYHECMREAYLLEFSGEVKDIQLLPQIRLMVESLDVLPMVEGGRYYIIVYGVDEPPPSLLAAPKAKPKPEHEYNAKK